MADVCYEVWISSVNIRCVTRSYLVKLSDVNNFKDRISNVRFRDLTKDSSSNDEGKSSLKELSLKVRGKNFTLTYDGTYFHINCNGVHRTLQLKNNDRRDIFDLFKRGITIVSELILFDLKESCICMNIYPFYDSQKTSGGHTACIGYARLCARAERDC